MGNDEGTLKIDKESIHDIINFILTDFTKDQDDIDAFQYVTDTLMVKYKKMREKIPDASIRRVCDRAFMSGILNSIHLEMKKKIAGWKFENGEMDFQNEE